jgi:hypothetical protein
LTVQAGTVSDSAMVPPIRQGGHPSRGNAPTVERSGFAPPGAASRPHRDHTGMALRTARVELAGGRDVVEKDPDRAVRSDGDVKELCREVAFRAARGLNVELVHECFSEPAGR